MFIIVVKALLEMVSWVTFLIIVMSSSFYMFNKDYQATVRDAVTSPYEPDLVDYFIIFSVFPGVLLRHCIKKLLKLIRKYVTMLQNRPRKIKVVIYYVPKHRRSNKG